MDGAWRRPPKSLADYGHTEPKRGAEWWGKSVLLTFGLFSKVSRRQGGTLSGRYLNNGYVLNLIQHPGRLSGHLREQARSHRLIVRCQIDMGRLAGRHRRQASSHITGQQEVIAGSAVERVVAWLVVTPPGTQSPTSNPRNNF